MGGRGGASGIAQASGFQYKQNGKTVTVQKTAAGVVLINGQKRTINYEKLKESAQNKTGYKNLSSKDFENMGIQKAEDYSSHDYELLDDMRKKRKSIYRPRRR